MYRVTFYTRATPAPRLETVTHPRPETAQAVARALRAQGFPARLWNPDGRLMSA